MIGKTVSHYTILERLGQGGMGVVYKAEDTKLTRTVALKFLSPGATGTEEMKARFEREARAAAALHHPNICPVYEIDEADGQLFMAMAYLPGQSLEDRITEGPIALADTIEIASQIAEGLKEAHDNDVVHRDIKGANIMLTEGRRVTIMDFGLAKLADQTMLTKEGTALGTVAYMSPEQARGDTVDRRTDIFALGVLLFEMIAGRRPFRGAHDSAVIYSIQNEDPDPLTAVRTDVPVSLEHVVNKMLAKDPADRYQNASDLIVDLRRVHKELGGEPSGVRRPAVSGNRGASLIQHLIERRVPQLLGIYLAVSFGVLQFVQWLVDRYAISPNLPDFCLALFASLLPTVLMVAYFHGKAGTTGWNRIEKVGIPANLAAAAAALFLMFQGKDIGAATTTVSTTDADGNPIERVIPKSEFRKKIALFYFENEADSTLDWMSYGVTYVLYHKLYQDDYLANWYAFGQRIKQTGLDDPTDIPLALKSKIAREYRTHYFVAGTIGPGEDADIIINAELYNTKNGRRLKRFRHETTDFFATMDSLSVQVRKEVGIPTYHLAESPDLPASEMFTESIEAMELYSIGTRFHEVDNDYRSARKALARAVQLDPTFAVAHLSLATVYEGLNEPYYTKQSYKEVLKHIYKLPESFQFTARVRYHFAHEEINEAAAEVERWVTLFPQSTVAHEFRARFYEDNNELDAAIAEWETILDLMPSRDFAYSKISKLYQAKGDFEQALAYAEQYAARLPGERAAHTALASLYFHTGDLEKNLEACKQAVRAEPDNVQSITNLAYSYARMGKGDQAFAQLQKALEFARSRRDSASVYLGRAAYYSARGRMKESIEAAEVAFSLQVTGLPPGYVPMMRASSLAVPYAQAGDETRAIELLQAAETAARDPFSKAIIASAHVNVYRELDDPRFAEDTERRIAIMEKALGMGGAEAYRFYPLDARGLVAEWRGDYAAARKHYEEAMNIVAKNDWATVRALHRRIGRACRKLGDPDAALSHLERALKVSPFNASYNYDIALVYHDRGNMEKAMEHLNRALEKWKEADPGFVPAEKARATLAEWQASGVATR